MTSPQARRGQGRQQRGNGRPLPRGNLLYTPGGSDARQWMERTSARLLVLLRQLPVWVPPVVVAGLLVLGLAVPGWLGATALVLVAAFLGWLAALSWPATTPNGKLLRVAAIVGVLLVAAIQAIR